MKSFNSVFTLEKLLFNFRQILREQSPELKELESKLRAAYIQKELTAQLAEKEAAKIQSKVFYILK